MKQRITVAVRRLRTSLKSDSSKILSVSVAVVFIGLQYQILLGSSSFYSAWRLHRSLQSQQALNETWQERNKVLAAEVQDLKKGHAAAEEIARYDLGMIKQDEIFYRIVTNTDDGRQKNEDKNNKEKGVHH